MARKKTSLDEIHDGCDAVFTSANYLGNLSEAFYMVGNDHMGTVLGAVSRDLLKAQSDIRGGCSLMVGERLRDAEQSTNTMMSALLAGAAIGRGHKDD